VLVELGEERRTLDVFLKSDIPRSIRIEFNNWVRETVKPFR